MQSQKILLKSILNKKGTNSLKRTIIALLCLLPIILYFLLPTKPEKNTILLLGDSISFAYGVRDDRNWVALLQHRLDEQQYHYKIINFGIPGDVTSNALKRLPWALKEYKPNITIIQIGSNDAIHGYPISLIKDNLQKMIRLAKQANSKVILLGMRVQPSYGGEKYEHDFAMIYPYLAKQEQIGYVPYFLRNVGDNSQLMQKDKLHPTQAGQPILMETIWPELKKTLDEMRQ